jgi:hypothetical protein
MDQLLLERRTSQSQSPLARQRCLTPQQYPEQTTDIGNGRGSRTVAGPSPPIQALNSSIARSETIKKSTPAGAEYEAPCQRFVSQTWHTATQGDDEEDSHDEEKFVSVKEAGKSERPFSFSISSCHKLNCEEGVR